MVCPECKSIETGATNMSAALAAYTSADSATVPACKHCNAVVACAKR